MADTKISALPASTTPLAGTEVLPIVQASTTVKVAVSDLTAGRAISATQLTLTTGNLIVANGQGIDFSATPSAGTSELFNDYEDGTWTPVPVPAAGSITSYTSEGNYTKIGRQVTAVFRITITNVGTATTLSAITGLPFGNNFAASIGVGREAAITGNMWQYRIANGTTTFQGYSYSNLATIATGYVLLGTMTFFN